MLAGCNSKKQSFGRSALKVSRDGLDHYMIQLYVRGLGISPKGRNEVTVRAGDILVSDLAQDTVIQTSDFENLSLVVPRALISGNLAKPDHQHQRVIPGDQPVAQLFKQMILVVFRNAPKMTIKDGMLSTSPLLRMTEGLLNSGDGVSVPEVDGSAVDQALLVGVKRFIEDHLADPALRPETIVARVGISRSSLYRLFEPLGGVASYIRTRRLRRSVRDLLDPGMERRRIYEIAYAWGFQRESDYARVFRREFGLTPREARTAGVLSAQGGKTFRGPFGDRNYEYWLRDLSRE